MAAITQDGKAELLAVYMIMLNTLPTEKKLGELIAQREQGQTIFKIAAELSKDAQFRKIYPQDQDRFAEKLVELLLNTDTPASAKAWAINWVITEFNSGKTESNIIVESMQAVRATTNTNYNTAKNKINNKIDAALYYTSTIKVDISIDEISAILNKITDDVSTFEQAKILINGLGPKSYTLSDAVNIGISKLPATFNLSNGDIDLGEGNISDINKRIEIVKNIYLKASNFSKLVFSLKYSLIDSFQNLTNKSNENIVANSNSYKANEINKDLGFISAYQANIIEKSKNAQEFSYLNIDKLETEAALILSKLGFTILQAKKYFISNLDHIEQIAQLLKEAKLTVNMVVAILKSSSSSDDDPVDITADQVRLLFKGYVADIYGTPGKSVITGTSGNNLIEGTDAGEFIEGKEGQDTVIYNGKLANYNLNKLYAGKSGGINGYSVINKLKPTVEDKINSDVEYILLKDEGLRLPTSGILIFGTESNDSISGTDLDEIIYTKEGDDVIKGGMGVDGVVFAGPIQQYQITKLYSGKNNSLSGYKFVDKLGISGTDEVSIDVETAYFLDSVINLSAYEQDLSPPSVKITAIKSHLKIGESVTINFDFTEDVIGFGIDDINANGGTLSGFIGLGKHYTALFSNDNSIDVGNISIKNNSLKDISDNEFISSITKEDDLDLLLDLYLKGTNWPFPIGNSKGDDKFEFKGGATINGGPGLDQVIFKESFDRAQISGDKNLKVEIRTSATNSIEKYDLTSIERIQFNNLSKAYDVSNFTQFYNEVTNPGNAGVVARILYSILGPDTVRLPLFVGVGLKQIEELGKSPVELAAIAAEFKLGPNYSLSNLFELIYSNVKPKGNISKEDWLKEVSSLFDTPTSVFQQMIYHEVYAGLVGIQSLDYYPQ